MSVSNALEVKEKIVSIIRRRGPSLPVHIAKEVGLSILFASAFLSELVSEKTLQFTEMKVGNSPLYFLNEQIPMLEKFGNHLKSKEKDAFNLLKEKKFLVDRDQTPQIRVALRAIKDFAMPFNKDGQIIWRYYVAPESEFKIEVKEPVIELKEEKSLIKIEEKPIEIKIERIKEVSKEKEIKKEKLKKAKIKKIIKKKTRKNDDNFFNKIKEWALRNSMEILDIENFNRNELQLRIKENGEEKLLMAYNKKRITDNDLIRANKKAKELSLKYIIVSLGEPIKKMNEFIEAAKNLSDIKKIDAINDKL